MEIASLTSLSASQNVDPREAELSAFMSAELGEGSQVKNTVEENTKTPKQRKKYVSENRIKARFTYGAVKRQRSSFFDDEDNTANNAKSATTCIEDPPANDISLLLNCLSDLQTITFDFSKPSQVNINKTMPTASADSNSL